MAEGVGEEVSPDWISTVRRKYGGDLSKLEWLKRTGQSDQRVAFLNQEIRSIQAGQKGISSQEAVKYLSEQRTIKDVKSAVSKLSSQKESFSSLPIMTVSTTDIPRKELPPIRSIDYVTATGKGAGAVTVKGTQVWGGGGAVSFANAIPPRDFGAGAQVISSTFTPEQTQKITGIVPPTLTPQQQAQQNLLAQAKALQQYTAQDTGYAYGGESFISAATGGRFVPGVVTARGQVGLTPEQEISLRRLTGGPGGPAIGGGQFAFTPSGAGTIITETRKPDFPPTRYDLKDAIDFQANAKLDKFYKEEINKATKEIVNPAQEKLENRFNDLQAQVTSGTLDVNEANRQLKAYQEAINERVQKEYKSTLTSNLAKNSNIKQIETNLISDYKKYGVTNLEGDVIKEKKDQLKENTRLIVEGAVEVGAVVVGTYFGGPGVGAAAGVGASKFIAAGRGISAGGHAMKGTVPVYDIKYDAQGKVIDVKIAKEVLTPEAKSKVTQDITMAGLSLVAPYIPTPSGVVGGKVVWEKSIAAQAKDYSMSIASKELLEQQIKSGAKTISQEELKRGLIKTELRDTFGNPTGRFVDIPLSNIKALKFSEEVAIRRARDIALGKDKELKFISAGTREEIEAVTANIQKNELGSYRIGDKTINELVNAGSIQKYTAYDLNKAKDVYFYGVRSFSTVGGKGKQIDIMFRLNKKGISKTGAKVVVTDMETGVMDLYRMASLKEMSKETVKVPVLGSGQGAVEVFGIERLKQLDKRLILQKANIEQKVIEGGVIRQIKKEAVAVKIGKPIRGAPTVSLEQAIKQKPQVYKKVTPELLSRMSSTELQLLKDKSVKFKIDTLTDEISLIMKKKGLTVEKGVGTKIPKPIDLFITKTPTIKKEITETTLKKLQDTSEKQITKALSKKSFTSQILDTPIIDFPKMVGGEGKVDSTIAFQKSISKTIPFSMDLFGTTKIKGAVVPKLGTIQTGNVIFGAGPILRGTGTLQLYGTPKTNVLEKQIFKSPALLDIEKLSPKLIPRPVGRLKAFVEPTQLLIPRAKLIPVEKQTQRLLTKLAVVPVVIPKIPRRPITPVVLPSLFPTIIPPWGRKLTGYEFGKRRKDIFAPSRKPKYTASLASAVFGIKTRVRASKLKALQKQLDKISWSGAEMRPLIEVVDGIPKKKKNVKIKPLVF